MLGASSNSVGWSRIALPWAGFVLLVLPFLVWAAVRTLTLDFWYDEIYTLDFFVFVPLRQTLTDYSDPNNHVFYNLLNGLFVRLLGLPDTFAAMDEPHLLRLPPLLHALLTLALVFHTARRYAGLAAGYLAVAVLATTVPFFNFATQVRGYSLSMLLLSAMVLFLLRFLEQPRWPDAAAITATGALALYTIPSNLYFLLSAGLFCGVRAAVRAVRSPRSQGATTPQPSRNPLRPFANRNLAAVALMAAAVLAAILLYAPMLPQVVSNPYVQGTHPLDPDTLVRLTPRMWQYLLSGRFALMLLPVLAIAAWMRQPGRGVAPGTLRLQWLLCLALLVLPFAASSLRGDRPPDRIFVNLAPIFSLLVAISARIAWDILPARRGFLAAAMASAVPYCYVMFALSLRDMDAHLLADIQQVRKSQDSFYAYYQAYYAPHRLTTQLMTRFNAEPGPVYVYDYGDKAATYRYLQKTRLPCVEVAEPGEIDLAITGVAYVVTAWPQRCRQRILQARPTLHCDLPANETAFQGVLVCRLSAPHVPAASQSPIKTPASR
jgi:hypothetical protein